MAKSRARSGNSHDRLTAQIKRGEFAPLYLLHGSENVTRDESLKALLDAAVDPASRAFNLDIFHGEDMDAADAVSRASAFPMMAARRVVVVKRLERLRDADARALLPLIDDPVETTVLVFTADKLDGRKKLTAALRKNAVSVEFKPPYENELPQWIRRRAAALSKRIEPEAAHMLHLGTGSNPGELASELEKLAIYTNERDTITRDDVVQAGGASRSATVFELADAVGQRKTGDALNVLHRLLDRGDSPVAIVAMLIRHVGILRKARWLRNYGLPRSEMAVKLRVPPFFVSGYLDQAARFDEQNLWHAFEALLNADNRLKSHSRAPAATLTQLICRVCSGAAV
ncbi:MAG: DNA polymerase III subunit delta [Gemmatimonadota bacterium]|nr:DNA polymerase III subunit delta [Gemmatimonadota bacterium]